MALGAGCSLVGPQIVDADATRPTRLRQPIHLNARRGFKRLDSEVDERRRGYEAPGNDEWTCH
jgi:hypothetical protein